ncbi:hypothetical protein Areg01_54190 [Actinoplanes regularis]|nr:hypothetical protein Areg01_54190 [Actinoplanes regularis]
MLNPVEVTSGPSLRWAGRRPRSYRTERKAPATSPRILRLRLIKSSPIWSGTLVGVSEPVITEPAGWINLPDLAERFGLSISKVNQMIKDGDLLFVRRDGVRLVPAELVANDTVLKHLPGVLNVLRDAGYNDEEAFRWLYEADPSVGGSAAIALGGPQAREVKRRAQALGF